MNSNKYEFMRKHYRMLPRTADCIIGNHFIFAENCNSTRLCMYKFVCVCVCKCLSRASLNAISNVQQNCFWSVRCNCNQKKIHYVLSCAGATSYIVLRVKSIKEFIFKTT